MDQAIRLVGRWDDLGRAIRDARLKVGFTQQQLAERAGISLAWLARVESGHRKAEIEYVMRTLAALGLSLALAMPPDDTDPALAEALRIAGLSS